jgi:hypothetical protein
MLSTSVPTVLYFRFYRWSDFCMEEWYTQVVTRQITSNILLIHENFTKPWVYSPFTDKTIISRCFLGTNRVITTIPGSPPRTISVRLRPRNARRTNYDRHLRRIPQHSLSFITSILLRLSAFLCNPFYHTNLDCRRHPNDAIRATLCELQRFCAPGCSERTFPKEIYWLDTELESSKRTRHLVFAELIECGILDERKSVCGCGGARREPEGY